MRNEPREIPYEFRVVAFDNWCWLYDASERTFACSATPLHSLVPLYPLFDPEEWSEPDPILVSVSTIAALDTRPVPLAAEYTAADVSEDSAWEAAHEEACANCIL